MQFKIHLAVLFDEILMLCHILKCCEGLGRVKMQKKKKNDHE